MQRRLVKAMEDLVVQYDGTVRNSLGEVVQVLYCPESASLDQYAKDGAIKSWIPATNTQKRDLLSACQE